MNTLTLDAFTDMPIFFSCRNRYETFCHAACARQSVIVDCASLDDIPNHFDQPRPTPVLMIIIKRYLAADERCFNRQVKINIQHVSSSLQYIYR
eukprot:scaffold15825_cov85-Skeletonema_dohrnii-CCMP3373.AAC.2